MIVRPVKPNGEIMGIYFSYRSHATQWLVDEFKMSPWEAEKYADLYGSDNPPGYGLKMEFLRNDPEQGEIVLEDNFEYIPKDFIAISNEPKSFLRKWKRYAK